MSCGSWLQPGADIPAVASLDLISGQKLSLPLTLYFKSINQLIHVFKKLIYRALHGSESAYPPSACFWFGEICHRENECLVKREEKPACHTCDKEVIATNQSLKFCLFLFESHLYTEKERDKERSSVH